MRFKNPWSSANVTELTLMAWLRTPIPSPEDYTTQRFRLLDCGDMLSVGLNGTNLRVNITTTNGTSQARQGHDVLNLVAI
jgi:hypothetical protein